MKRWKRVMLMGSILTGTFTAGVFAEDVLQRVEAYLRPDFNIVVDGKPVQLEGPTLVYQDKSYLPLKELGNLLGANILWKNENKTIYINSRINPEQKDPDINGVYEEIKLRSPYAQTVSYLGAEYPLLSTYGDINSTQLYYRLSDIKAMGIKTDGLTLAKEVFTNVFYVSESEVKKKWGQGPTPSRTSTRDNVLITGELNQDKIKVLQDYVKNTLSYKVKDTQYFTKPIIMDKIDGEDRYQYLYYQTIYLKDITVNHYYLSIIRLGKDGWGDTLTYTINADERTDIESKYQEKINKQANEAQQTP
ncbi:stalk domain-containing protein [Paenibacillus rigui]|uniref:Copper amine oxidase-like N-terminal domain-containing protein n=1 Tax=Paenibacillus rigui TaxID=554312 RepID=A0A229UQZ2_9BACL|nr:hypothetical protein CF651_11830 [Paenibacillus rigui]